MISMEADVNIVKSWSTWCAKSCFMQKLSWRSFALHPRIFSNNLKDYCSRTFFERAFFRPQGLSIFRFIVQKRERRKLKMNNKTSRAIEKTYFAASLSSSSAGSVALPFWLFSLNLFFWLSLRNDFESKIETTTSFNVYREPPRRFNYVL